LRIPEWQFREAEHPGANFDALAQIYDRNMQRFRDIAEEISEILDFLQPKPDQTLLDMGTGTGEFVLAAAPHCFEAYGIDLSESMLNCARNKARTRGLWNAHFLQGGFLSYDHQGPAPDAIVTQLALHHLPDFWKQIALIRMAGMLKSGGRLALRDVVYSFDIMDHEAAVCRLLISSRQMAGEEFAARMADHVRKEFSTMDWIMRGMIERAGFCVESERHRDEFLTLYLCTKIE